MYFGIKIFSLKLFAGIVAFILCGILANARDEMADGTALGIFLV